MHSLRIKFGAIRAILRGKTVIYRASLSLAGPIPFEDGAFIAESNFVNRGNGATISIPAVPAVKKNDWASIAKEKWEKRHG